VDFSGVGNFIDYPMRTYSTGMAQRLRFSIASAKNHEILMIDEALATGDANFRAKSHERIVELRGGSRHRVPGRAQPGRDRGELQPGDLAGEGPDHAAGPTTCPRSSTPTWKPPAASRASGTSPSRTSTAPTA